MDDRTVINRDQTGDGFYRPEVESSQPVATPVALLAVCIEAVAMDAKACCDTDPWLATDIRDRMVAAIAEAEGEKP